MKGHSLNKRTNERPFVTRCRRMRGCSRSFDWRSRRIFAANDVANVRSMSGPAENQEKLGVARTVDLTLVAPTRIIRKRLLLLLLILHRTAGSGMRSLYPNIFT